MNNKPVMKYIIIPDYKELYALRKIHGPFRGPISTPLRVSIDIVRDLLKQTNNLEVFEVIKRPDGEFSSKVRLSLENYDKSWFEIQGVRRPKLTGQEYVKPQEPVVEETTDKSDDEVSGELVEPVVEKVTEPVVEETTDKSDDEVSGELVEPVVEETTDKSDDEVSGELVKPTEEAVKYEKPVVYNKPDRKNRRR